MFGKNYYQINYTEEANDDLSKLPKSLLKIIKNAIDTRLTTYPESYGEALYYEFKGYRRLRVSKYRIIYCIEEDSVIVTSISHRQNAYK